MKTVVGITEAVPPPTGTINHKTTHKNGTRPVFTDNLNITFNLPAKVGTPTEPKKAAEIEKPESKADQKSKGRVSTHQTHFHESANLYSLQYWACMVPKDNGDSVYTKKTSPDPFTGEDDEDKKDFIARKVQIERAEELLADLKAGLHPESTMQPQIRGFEDQLDVLRQEYEAFKLYST